MHVNGQYLYDLSKGLMTFSSCVEADLIAFFFGSVELARFSVQKLIFTLIKSQTS